MDATWRRIYDEQLISGFLGRISGLTERLAAGIGVLDVGCGSGHAVNVMAREFPRSRFVGYDLAEDAIADGRAEASRMGLANVRFDVLDVAKLPGSPRFALVTAFDAIHDQLDPATVLARIDAALEDDGTFLMIDFKFASDVAGNIGNPFAPLYYGISLMHCMTVSLAYGTLSEELRRTPRRDLPARMLNPEMQAPPPAQVSRGHRLAVRAQASGHGSSGVRARQGTSTLPPCCSLYWTGECLDHANVLSSRSPSKDTLAGLLLSSPQPADFNAHTFGRPRA